MLRKLGAEEHLIEAMESTERELSDVARRLRQGTLFAVPKEQQESNRLLLELNREITAGNVPYDPFR